MEIWKFVPFQSVGPISFDNTKEEVFSKFSNLEKISKVLECYSYKDKEKHICIDLSTYVDSLTVFTLDTHESSKTLSITFENINLTKKNYLNTLKELFIKGYKIYGWFIENPMYMVKNLGIQFITSENFYGLNLSGVSFMQQDYFEELWDENKDDLKLITKKDLPDMLMQDDLF